MRFEWFALLVLCAGFLGIAYAARRSRALFALSIKQGRTTVSRGAPPPALVEALGDVFMRAQIEAAEVEIVKDGDRARILARGLDEHTLQRARNVLGTFPMHKLRR